MTKLIKDCFNETGLMENWKQEKTKLGGLYKFQTHSTQFRFLYVMVKLMINMYIPASINVKNVYQSLSIVEAIK
jgi:hypothetical protein